MTDIQHGKLITTTPQADGSNIIKTESFYDWELASMKEEKELYVITDKQNLLRDMIDAIKPLTSSESKVLSIQVTVDKQGRWILKKRWTLPKQQ